MIDMPVNADVYCLAENIYYEARSESTAGQRAVAYVTLNRVESPYYPNTVCEVVHEPAQFSWTLEPYYPITDKKAFDRAYEIAKSVYFSTEAYDITLMADHYHTVDVTPNWKNDKKITAVIGKHIFYRLYR